MFGKGQQNRFSLWTNIWAGQSSVLRVLGCQVGDFDLYWNILKGHIGYEDSGAISTIMTFLGTPEGVCVSVWGSCLGSYHEKWRNEGMRCHNGQSESQLCTLSAASRTQLSPRNVTISSAPALAEKCLDSEEALSLTQTCAFLSLYLPLRVTLGPSLGQGHVYSPKQKRWGSAGYPCLRSLPSFPVYPTKGSSDKHSTLVGSLVGTVQARNSGLSRPQV